MKINYLQKKVLKRAIDQYGADKQRLIVIEELSELQKAIIKQIRKPCQENVGNIAEEIADVYIMLKQLEMMYGIGTAIQGNISYKVKRLKKRLKEEQEQKQDVALENLHKIA